MNTNRIFSIENAITFVVFWVLTFMNPSLEQAGPSCTTPHQEAGTCKEVKLCTPIYNLILTRGREKTIVEYVRWFRCAANSSKSYSVCCPNSGLVIPPLSTSESSQRQTTYSCGVPGWHNSVIIGGANYSSLGDWPWIAAMGYETSNKQFTPACVGVLIDEQHVISAAHCVSDQGSVKVSSIRLGTVNLNSNINDSASQIDIAISKIIRHPNYTASPVLNDIAISKLNQSVHFTGLIRPICLLDEETHKNNSFYDGKLLHTAGWGILDSKGASSKMLEHMTLSAVNSSKCAASYANRTNVKINNSVICGQRTELCQGNSGGALMIPIGSTFYLAGVASYGYSCTNSNNPSVYTKIAYFAAWIRQNIKN